MTIEASQTINQLNTAYPRSSDLLKEGDDHIRMIKANLKNTFPNIIGTVTVSSDTLNRLDKGATVTDSGITFKTAVTVATGQTISAGNNRIQNVAPAVATNDAVNVAYLFKEFGNKIYPLGSIYLTTGSEDPTTIWGGHWEKKAPAQYLMGAGTESESGINWSVGANTSGGSHGFVLSAGNIPSHTHTISHGHTARTTSGGGHSHTIHGRNATGRDTQIAFVGTNNAVYETQAVDGDGSHGHGIQVDNFNGNSGTGNGLGSGRVGYTPRFYVVQVWRRTALA